MITKKILTIGLFSTIISAGLCNADPISDSFKINASKLTILDNVTEQIETPKLIDVYPPVNTSIKQPQAPAEAAIKQPQAPAEAAIKQPQLDNTSFAPLLLIQPETLKTIKSSQDVKTEKPAEINKTPAINKLEVPIIPKEIPQATIESPKYKKIEDYQTTKEVVTKKEVDTNKLKPSTEGEIAKLAKQEQEVWLKLKGKTIEDPDYLDLVTELNNIGIKRNEIIKSANIDPKTIVPVAMPKSDEKVEIKFIQNKVISTQQTPSKTTATPGNVIYTSIDMFTTQTETKKGKANSKTNEKIKIEKQLPLNDQDISTSNATSIPIKTQ